MSIVIPGDKLPISKEQLNSKPLVIGPALFLDKTDNNNEISIGNAGVFTHKEKRNKQLISIETSLKNYTPAVGDYVIGTVTNAFGDYFRVNLNEFKSNAMLSYLSFENATKKNRPNLKSGALVYARVKDYNMYMDLEIECFNSDTGKAEGFGELLGGHLILDGIDLAYTRYLIFNGNNNVLTILSRRVRFEIAIGVNGKIWLKCDDVKQTLAASEFILKAATIKDDPKLLQAELGEIWKKYGL